MTRRKRIYLAIGLCIALGCACFLFWPASEAAPSKLNEEMYQRIQLGMKKSQVIEILGEPFVDPGWLIPGENAVFSPISSEGWEPGTEVTDSEYWLEPKLAIHIVFDRASLVVGKEFHSVRRLSLDTFTRLLIWLGIQR